MTVDEFVDNIDANTPERVILTFSPEEFEKNRLEVSATLLSILGGARIKSITGHGVDGGDLMIFAAKGNRVFGVDYCKYGVTLVEFLPSEPLNDWNYIRR